MQSAAVFLSYAAEDRNRAQAVVAALEQEDIEVWWDQRLRAGDNFPSEIEAKVRAASCIVVLWSVASIQSRWVRAEASIGANRGVLVPLLAEPCELPLEFTNLQVLDVSDWLRKPSQDITDRLIASIRARMGQTELTSTFKAPDRVAELQRQLLMAPDSRALRAAAYELEEITKRQPGNVPARLLHDDYREAMRRDERLHSQATASYRMASRSKLGWRTGITFLGFVILASVAVSLVYGYGLVRSVLLGAGIVIATLLAFTLIPFLLMGLVSAYEWMAKKLRRGKQQS